MTNRPKPLQIMTSSHTPIPVLSETTRSSTDHHSNRHNTVHPMESFPPMIQPIWLQEYIQFHQTHVTLPVVVSTTRPSNGSSHRRRRQRKPTLSYRLNISKNDTTTTNAATVVIRTLTYYCNGQHCGGLGDRLLGIVQAFYLAICTNRIFVIDYRDLTHYIPPNHFLHWDIDTSNMDHDDTDDDNTIRIRAMDDRNNPYLLDSCTTMNATYNVHLQTNVWLGDAFIHSPCWQQYLHNFDRGNANDNNNNQRSSFTSDELFRIAFHTLFQWSEPLQEAVLTLRQQAELADRTAPANQEPYDMVVAMHIRTGLLDKNNHIKSSTQSNDNRPYHPEEWMQFLQCAQKLQTALLVHTRCESVNMRNDDNHNDDNHTAATTIALYLATDHIAVKDYLTQQGDASIKMIRDLEIHHVDDGKRRRHNPLPDDHQNSHGEMMAWGELWLLQSSTCIVQSHSKYSAVAGILSRYGCAIYYDDCSDANVHLAVQQVVLQQNHTRQQCM